MNVFLRYLGTVAAVFLTINLVGGLAARGGWLTIFLVALVWSVISMVIKPVLRILTLPITFLTLGLSSLLINTLLFCAMTLIVPGFVVANFFSAFLGAIVLSIFNWFIHLVLRT
jgi:putative membrane protein